MFRFVMKTIVSCLVLFLGCVAATAQASSATLTGTVEDQNGAVIPGVTVRVQDRSTAFERTVTTNESGSFTVPLLPPGTYTVTARRDGFMAAQVQDINLNVADQKTLVLTLKVGDQKEVVDVTADAFLVNTSTSVSTTIDRTIVQNMPLNSRSFTSLVLLTPGVTLTPTTGQSPGSFSVNGMRSSTNVVTVDGVSANIGIDTGTGLGGSLQASGALPGNSAFGSSNNLVSIDALEEFKVQTSGYTADSGRQPGGQVQVVTRSGKNTYQGTIYEYFRNEALDARDYFNKKPALKPALRQNHFGGTFSGPLPFLNFGDGDGKLFHSGKDRTFFFFSYEAQRLKVPQSGSVFVPSERLREVAHISLKPLLNAFPRPTRAELRTTTTCLVPPIPVNCDTATGFLWSGAAPFDYSMSSPSNLTATSIRIDHHLTSGISVFGRFNESPSDSTAGVYSKTQTAANTRTLTLGSNWTLNQNIGNELRFNYSRQTASSTRPFISINGSSPFDENLLTNGYGGLGNLTVSLLAVPVQSFGGSLSLQLGAANDTYQEQYNVVDNFTMVKGNHLLKFGLDIRWLRPALRPLDQDQTTLRNEAEIRSGTVSYSNFHFVPVRPRYTNISLYAQDTWKVSNRLTLDLGLRWEINPPPTEVDGILPRVVLGVVGTDVRNAVLAPVGTPFYKTYYKAFAPRFGAAYQLFQNPGFETVLRGGFGVYYDLGSGTAAGGWPFFVSKPGVVSPTFPISAAQATRATFVPANTSTFALAEDLRLPYNLAWNVTIEQQIGKSQVVSLAYVASAGRQLLATHQLNQQPRDPITGDLLPRPNSNFGAVTYSYNGPRSDYHSMQAQYRSRFAKRFQGLLNYTWGHAIDEVSSDLNALAFEKGNASFDVRHNFSASLHYDIPTIGSNDFVRAVTRGWQIDAIIHAQSGFPFDPGAVATLSIEDRLVTVRPDLILGVPLYLNDPGAPGGRRVNRAAFRQAPTACLPAGQPNCVVTVIREGSLGRNVLRNLPLYQVDLSLGRTFRFGERLGLQLKGEAFNVLNRPHFSNPLVALSLTDAAFGIPTQTLSQNLGGLNRFYQIGGPRSIQLSARMTF